LQKVFVLNNNSLHNSTQACEGCIKYTGILHNIFKKIVYITVLYNAVNLFGMKIIIIHAFIIRNDDY
jgi:hypothetical protein